MVTQTLSRFALFGLALIGLAAPISACTADRSADPQLSGTAMENFRGPLMDGSGIIEDAGHSPL